MGRRASGGSGLLLLCALACADADAAVVAVRHCGDAGAGSLRAAVAGAGEGDTVDLRGLACRTIDLTSGPIAIPQRVLEIRGPGFNRLTVTARGRSRVFAQPAPSAGARLTLRGMAVEYGRDRSTVGGGCVYTPNALRLIDVHVRHCRSDGDGGGAHGGSGLEFAYAAAYSNRADDGGGLHTAGLLRVHRARIVRNTCRANGCGAAVVGTGRARISDSTIADNGSVDGVSGVSGLAVSSWPVGDTALELVGSTLSGNTAAIALRVERGLSILVNSTVSGNRVRAAVASFGGDVQIHASTFAYNATTDCGNPTIRSEGSDLELVGSIVAHSTCGDGMPHVDLGDPDDAGAIRATRTIATRIPETPFAGIRVVDPLLGPLQLNGGRTATHALRPGSPAIDTGTNPLELATDQRGAGYPRTVGAATDVGAYEADAP